MSGERPCSLLVFDGMLNDLKAEELRKRLEQGPVSNKVGAMKKIVVGTANGVLKCTPQLLLAIIRFVIPEQDRTLKKLCLLFWECVDKVDPSTGKLRPEFILVCNSLLHDLQDANEFISGFTLRLLTHVRDADILEPLVAAVTSCLSHKHAFVRRNAVWALCAMFRNFPQLVPNAPDLIAALLETETDAIVKRNALVVLFLCAKERASEYIDTLLPNLPNLGETSQLAVIQLITKIAKSGCSPVARSNYVTVLTDIVAAAAPSVRFEAANTLLTLTVAPAPVRAAALAFVDILATESDNNVKTVALARLEDMASRQTTVMQDVVLDVLRGLVCPALELRRRTLAVALTLVTQKTVLETVQFLKRELTKTSSGGSTSASAQGSEVATDSSSEKGISEYRQLLVQAIHACAVRFPSVASDVVHVLMDYLQEPSTATDSASEGSLATSAYDVVAFIREAAEKFPDLRPAIVAKLASALPKIRSAKVFRAALWVLGEYALTIDDVNAAFVALKLLLRDIPAVIADNLAELAALEAAAAASSSSSEEEKAPKQTNVRVLADGTYATQASFATSSSDSSSQASGASAAATAHTTEEAARARSPLLGLLLDGDHYVAAVAGYTLTKLAVRAASLPDVSGPTGNRFHAEITFLVAQLLRLGRSRAVSRPMDSDSQTRLLFCLAVLSDPKHPARPEMLSDSARSAFVRLLEEQGSVQQRASAAIGGTVVQGEAKKKGQQADDLIRVRQLTAKERGDSAPDEDEEGEGEREEGGDKKEKEGDSADRLERVVQLTGFGDALYAEAFVYVRQYDIGLDVVITNQTSVTLQNVTLELAMLGDLKLFERPDPVTLASGCSAQVHASLKVSSTETAVIFGSLTFEQAGQAVTTTTADKNCVPLNELKIDIIDYIRPATCTDVKFRQMWAEFEWENKIAVAVYLPGSVEYLKEVLAATNMICLTPESALAGDCTFLAANLYARSIFGEDALANVSVEYDSHTRKVSGYVRIRAKTQGIALSLGDKIVSMQRQHKTPPKDLKIEDVPQEQIEENKDLKKQETEPQTTIVEEKKDDEEEDIVDMN